MYRSLESQARVGLYIYNKETHHLVGVWVKGRLWLSSDTFYSELLDYCKKYPVRAHLLFGREGYTRVEDIYVAQKLMKTVCEDLNLSVRYVEKETLEYLDDEQKWLQEVFGGSWLVFRVPSRLYGTITN